MAKIKLTQNKYAIVDDEDYEWLNQWKWCVLKNNYGGFRAVRMCNCPLVKQNHIILMHRQIMSCPQNLEVDHINHNTLDNRKSNLRNVNRQQSSANQKARKGTSKYKGVHWSSRKKRWMAYIKNNYKSICIGSYSSQIKAAKAYDEKAKELFGEYAYLNFR